MKLVVKGDIALLSSLGAVRTVEMLEKREATPQRLPLEKSQ